MGDSACLMQVQPFSYTAGLPNEAKEGNPVHALGQSVSFGRFMSESLSWEKWSTFSHNKYVEEAERYARPGSVAQKKAFFEAHYKTLAARKAAALLEQQANAAANINGEAKAEAEAEDGVQDIITTKSSEIMNSNTQMTETASIYDNSKENNPNSVKFGSSKVQGAADSVAEQHVLLENNMKKQSFEKNGVFDKELELSEGTQMEKPLLKSANTNQDEFEVTSKRKPPYPSSKVSSSPAKFTAPIGPKKRNNLTPMAKKSAIDISDRKRSTPKSSHKSITFTPAKEFNRLTSSIIRKIDGSRIGSNSKASKECPTPLRTPNTASTSGRAKQPLATPWSEKKSARTPVKSSASVSKTARGKWHFLPTDCSKFLSACRNKSQSPGIFSAFSLRTEERAARRKQRLEEKFNVSQEQKVQQQQQQQQQTTLKEKAETELKKLGQSFCFKARPLPDFYKERRTTATKDQMQKVSLTQPESSPGLGRKSTPSKPSTVKGKSSLPYLKSSIKNTRSGKEKPDFSSFSQFKS